MLYYGFSTSPTPRNVQFRVCSVLALPQPLRLLPIGSLLSSRMVDKRTSSILCSAYEILHPCVCPSYVTGRSFRRCSYLLCVMDWVPQSVRIPRPHLGMSGARKQAVESFIYPTILIYVFSNVQPNVLGCRTVLSVPIPPDLVVPYMTILAVCLPKQSPPLGAGLPPLPCSTTLPTATHEF